MAWCAVPTVVDGVRFASKAEAARYAVLKLRERAGEISRLQLQPVFPLVVGDRPVLIRSDRYPNGRKARYTADFAYVEGGERIVEEFKGRDTMESRLRRAVAEAIYGICIRVTRAPRRGRRSA